MTLLYGRFNDVKTIKKQRPYSVDVACRLKVIGQKYLFLSINLLEPNWISHNAME